MITKISTIKNLAVFKNFDWDSTVRDGGNKIVSFARLNIIYGRNYSGKTTLSRIIQALETGGISDKYQSPEFRVEFDDSTIVNQAMPRAHSFQVRVFNEDFVRSNLKVFFDENEAIESFAVVGKQNVEDAEKLKIKKVELGSVEKPGPMSKKESEAKTELSQAKVRFKNASDSLDDQLREKANSEPDGIKYEFSEPKYTISSIRKDIKTVQEKSYHTLTSEEVEEKTALRKEQTKVGIPEREPLTLEYTNLVDQAKELLEREISVTKSIAELSNNPEMQEWVRKGRKLHEGVRDTCGFCGNKLSDGLWSILEKHFNKESEELRDSITNLRSQINKEINDSSSFLEVDEHAFYGTYGERVQKLKTKIEASFLTYQSALQKVNAALEERHKDVFKGTSLPELPDATQAMQETHQLLNQLISESNDYTTTLTQEQTKARILLRLHEVSNFITTIKYDDQMKNITSLEVVEQDKRDELGVASKLVEDIEKEIANLKAGMSDEENAVNQVNDLLNHHFGHPALSLEAVKSVEGEKGVYSFEIQRNKKHADNLSEGERGLIAFCYFVARLEDVNTTGTNPIIWIDDPVSSLDDNHSFFIYSLIRSRIVEQYPECQLLISTHSLSFLKYMKRLPGKRENFLVHRNDAYSTIQKMPTHLSEIATEFNYLFQQIYMFATSNPSDEVVVNMSYTIGNNVRKFLEMYLYFKFPNPEIGQLAGLTKFFGKDRVAAVTAERLYNEYSHLRGVLERGMEPLEIPAMQTLTKSILNRLQEDSDQYNSLLNSIGEEPLVTV